MINPKHLAWLESRAIDPEVVARMGIYSGRRQQVGAEPDAAAEVVPDPAGPVLCFPYIENEKDVNVKYRGPSRPDGSKVFWQRAGGKKTFYNADILSDPSLREGGCPLVIVEGEPDLLAVLTARYPFVVSVPDGAPAARDQHGNPLPPVPDTPHDIDPADDAKFAYIPSCWDRLKDIKEFVLFTDGDEPGQRLRDELARRLGRVRCSFVTYPDLKGKKADANEVLKQHGPDAVMRMIQTATPYPVRGLYRLDEFPDQPAPVTYSTGWSRLDRPAPRGQCAVMLEKGAFMVVLGQPSAGKSTWVLQLAMNLAETHGWRIGVCSFEMNPVPHVRDFLRMCRLRKPSEQWSSEDRRQTDGWIREHIIFIHSDPEHDDEPPTLGWLLDRARDAVVRYGINMLLIDPWNEIEHERERHETGTEYAGRAIRQMKQFARSLGVLVLVCIHPTKSASDKPQSQMSLYDADGSAHWVNKPDIGLVIERDDEGGRMIVHGKKFRYRWMGQRGATEFPFDPNLSIVGD